MWCSIGAAALVLAVSLVLVFTLLIPYNNAKNTMDPNGTLTLQVMEDGKLQLQWPAGTNAQAYQLQVLEEDGTQLHCQTVDSTCTAILPKLPDDRELVVRITSTHSYGKKQRPGDEMLEVAVQLQVPQAGQVQQYSDPAAGTVDAQFTLEKGDHCRVYAAVGDEEPALFKELTEGSLTVQFGEGKDFAVPEHDSSVKFYLQPYKKAGQVHFQGQLQEGFTVTREHLLGDTLTASYTDNGENSYTLTWNETKGDHYEIRLSDDGGQTWQVLATVAGDQERTYTTKHLDAYTDYQLWVVAVGGQTLPDSDLAAHSKPLELRTGAKLLYSTIWPLMDQKVYADVAATQELGTAPAGSAWCVLGQEDKYLKIRFEGQDGYIDSNYCMINLPEYIGPLCAYNITNSYDSIYLVHEYGIANVSGTVITGYEDVQLAEGEYLVPLLYPTAQKLIKAGEAAREQGYRLKIYDSYRPKNATNRIYSLTALILEEPVPYATFSGKMVNDLNLLKWKPEEEAPEEPEDDPTEETTEATQETTQPTEATQPEEKRSVLFTQQETWNGLMKGLTYKILMTNDGEYSLSAFLAAGISRHNLGVAVDITLEDANGRELPMQTSMHDLSWYSASKRNNGNALILYKLMTGAGMTDLYSEWWHFQDNEAVNELKPEPLYQGVSCQCWVMDETGWRYRLADGSFYTDCTKTIDGESYTFDKNGYVTQ